MRILFLACLALSGCAAPRWVNPEHPAADLHADMAVCEKDAERLVRLSQLAHPDAFRNPCSVGANCAGDSQGVGVAAEGLGAQKRCLAARGWQQQF